MWRAEQEPCAWNGVPYRSGVGALALTHLTRCGGVACSFRALSTSTTADAFFLLDCGARSAAGVVWIGVGHLDPGPCHWVNSSGVAALPAPSRYRSGFLNG